MNEVSKMRRTAKIAIITAAILLLNMVLSLGMQYGCSISPEIEKHLCSHDHQNCVFADDGKCIKCDGSKKCQVCSGSGKNSSGNDCSICDGTGKCYYCSGTGKS